MLNERLLAEASRLDEAFQAAVIKQFGHNNAGNLRYVLPEHNEETRTACIAYQRASIALIDALQAARKRGVS